MTERTSPPERPAPSQGPARTTLAAGLLAILVSIPFLIRGIGSLLVALNPDVTLGYRRAMVTLGIPASAAEVTTAATIGSVVTLVLTALALLLAAGILRRRQWAREGGLGLFGLFGIVLVLLALQGLTSTPRGPNAVWGLLIGVLNLTIAVLLLRPSTVRDMDRAELARKRAREERRRHRQRAGQGPERA